MLQAEYNSAVDSLYLLPPNRHVRQGKRLRRQFRSSLRQTGPVLEEFGPGYEWAFAASRCAGRDEAGILRVPAAPSADGIRGWGVGPAKSGTARIDVRL